MIFLHSVASMTSLYISLMQAGKNDFFLMCNELMILRNFYLIRLFFESDGVNKYSLSSVIWSTEMSLQEKASRFDVFNLCIYSVLFFQDLIKMDLFSSSNGKRPRKIAAQKRSIIVCTLPNSLTRFATYRA